MKECNSGINHNHEDGGEHILLPLLTLTNIHINGMHADKRLILFGDIFWTFKSELSSIVSQGRIEPAWLWGKKKERN